MLIAFGHSLSSITRWHLLIEMTISREPVSLPSSAAVQLCARPECLVKKTCVDDSGWVLRLTEWQPFLTATCQTGGVSHSSHSAITVICNAEQFYVRFQRQTKQELNNISVKIKHHRIKMSPGTFQNSRYKDGSTHNISSFFASCAWKSNRQEATDSICIGDLSLGNPRLQSRSVRIGASENNNKRWAPRSLRGERSAFVRLRCSHCEMCRISTLQICRHYTRAY